MNSNNWLWEPSLKKATQPSVTSKLKKELRNEQAMEDFNNKTRQEVKRQVKMVAVAISNLIKAYQAFSPAVSLSLEVKFLETCI